MDRARKAFETGRSKTLEYRIEQLKNLQRLFTERQKEIADAIKKDLNKVSGLYCLHTLFLENWRNVSEKMLTVTVTVFHTYAKCKRAER